MNMAAKGFTHFLLFWLFVAGIVGLFYRQEIGEWVVDISGDSEIAAYLKGDDEDTTAPAEGAAPMEDKAESPTPAEPAAEPGAPAATPVVSETPPAPAAQEATAPAATETESAAAQPRAADAQPQDAPAEPSPASETEPAPRGEPETVPAAEPQAEPEPQLVAQEQAAMPTPMPAAPTPAPAPVQPAPPQTVAPDLMREWSRARDLYWRGDRAKAEEAYMALVRDHADEPDLAGELANLLLQMGKHEDAAGFYLEAGLRMLRGPMPGRAGMVAGILDGLSPEKAELLREKLFQRMNPAAQQAN